MRAFDADAPRGSLRRRLDWGSLAPLRLRARSLAHGLWGGGHRSARRGSGVEFGGFREYVAGDDLRFLDRRALLRFDKLQVRQFETETERALRLVLDGSPSMSYKGRRALGAKYAYGALLAAALAHVVLRDGDPLGLSILDGGRAEVLPLARGRDAFERAVALLERETLQPIHAAGQDAAVQELERVARSARSGSLQVLISDWADAGTEWLQSLSLWPTRGRRAVLVHVLDPDELDFPFEGPLRLRALEGDARLETDGAAAEGYREAMASWRDELEQSLRARGVRFLPVRTDEPPEKALRELLTALL